MIYSVSIRLYGIEAHLYIKYLFIFFDNNMPNHYVR